MRLLVATALLLFFGSAEAREAKKRDPILPGIAVEEQLARHGTYVNKMGEDVHKPSEHVLGGVPDGATAKCGDGTFSFSHSRSGTCSRHDGVGQWLR